LFALQTSLYTPFKNESLAMGISLVLPFTSFPQADTESCLVMS